jgi:hypothetical protein
VSSVSIRSATADDAIAVLGLWRAAGSVPTRTDDLQSIATLLARDPRALLLAEQNGELIGALIASFDGWRGATARCAHDTPSVYVSAINAARARVWSGPCLSGESYPSLGRTSLGVGSATVSLKAADAP